LKTESEKKRGFGKMGFPLAALAGQERMKLALLLLGVDPGLGGVLLVGQKGTAKSTAVRGLAEILPRLTIVSGCPFHCDPERPVDFCPACAARAGSDRLPREITATPLLTLPLGATEDRVVGGLDLEKSAKTGRPHLSPGLLGQANRGYLYVDEVNLLEPYLAHLLLDAVEAGRLRVEREGLSLWHPAREALIGTMNPEEGALGPQLKDRFALVVQVEAETEVAVRTEIVRRRLEFEADPLGFRHKWAWANETLALRMVEARRRLPETGLTAEARRLIVDLVREARARGHRGDLALARGALALAAWQGEALAGNEQVLAMADLVLDSRLVKPRSLAVTVMEKPVAAPAPQHFEVPYVPPSRPQTPLQMHSGTGDDRPLVGRLYQSNDVFEVVTPNSKREQGDRARSGRRSARKSLAGRGRYYRSSPERLGRPVALDATLRAAAPHQPQRRQGGRSDFIIRRHDVHEKVFRQKTGRLVLFVVDASGSVGSLDRMSEAKAAALSLLNEAYQKRDRVGLISFNGSRASILLPPTNSVELASHLLEELPTGGKTPLAAALVSTEKLLRVELARDPGLTPLVIIMTDGRPNVSLSPGVDPWREVLQLAGYLARDRRLKFLLVDTDQGYYNDYKMTPDLAQKLGAPRLTLEDLRCGRLGVWLEQVA
jgi:magnesium chelatase subunit D